MENPDDPPVLLQSDYKHVLRAKIRANARTYGYQSRLAKAANCQKSFLSAVVNSDSHWSLEHAMGAARFWELDRKETTHLIDLVSYARAGNAELKAHLKERIERRRIRAASAKANEPAVLADDVIGLYYAQWYYCAIHVLLTIPGFRTEAEIADRLGIPESFAREAIEDLERMRIVAPRADGGWTVLVPTLRLPRSRGDLWRQSRRNWNERVLLDIARATPDSIHHAAICSVSRKDADRIRRLAIELTERANAIVDHSPSEEIVCLALSYFTV